MENKLTKEIERNYPKVWKMLKEKYDYKPLHLPSKIIYSFYENQIRFRVFEKDYTTFTLLPFYLLYALLKNFFKDSNIKIVNCYRCDEEKYYPEIYNGNYPEYIEFENVFENENDCERFAILEACKILEG